MDAEEIHVNLAREALQRFTDEDDALALMVLLHTHQIRLKEPILDDRPGITLLSAITQRHAAEVVAATWPDRTNTERTSREYWYYQFNSRTPYEVVDDISSDWMTRVQLLRAYLASVSIVKAVEPE